MMVISFVQSQFLVATCCTGAGPGQWNVRTHLVVSRITHFLALVGCVMLSNQGNVPACALAKK
jgi:hypothetical protein